MTQSLLSQFLKSHPLKSANKAAVAYLSALDSIREDNPEIADRIIRELQDQRSHVKLIASENYSSLRVQLSMGNLLTDKYCEGYVNHRFYAGCENIDVIEEQAINSLKMLFKVDHAYVQPHSGADANLVAFWAILVQKVESKEVQQLGHKTINDLTQNEYEQVRQTIVNQKMMGLSLASGGHLTHGYRLNVSGKMMHCQDYHVDPKTERINYSTLEKAVKAFKPLILTAGYSAYPRLINFAKMREIADQVGAVLLVDMAHFAGLVAGKALVGEYDPAPFAHVITSTTHKTLKRSKGRYDLMYSRI